MAYERGGEAMRTVKAIEEEIDQCREKIRTLEVELDVALISEYGIKIGDVVAYEGTNYMVSGIKYHWVEGHPEKIAGGWSKNTRTLYNFKGVKP
jgi:hypothetical protein